MRHIARFSAVLLIVLSSESIPLFGQWMPTNGPYEPGDVRAVHVGRDGRVWVGMLLGALYCSSNAGQSFSLVNPLTDISPTSIHYDKHGCLFVGDGQGVLRSTDEGNSWSQVLSSGTAAVQQIVRDSSGTIFVATRGAGLFRSMDDGTTWLRSDFGLAYPYIRAVGVGSTGHVFASIHKDWESCKLCHSGDYGWTWDTLALPWSVIVTSFAIAPNGTIVASFHSGGYPDSCGFLLSTNNGVSWEKQNISLSYPYLDSFPVIYDQPSGVFVAALSGSITYANTIAILRSSNNGRTWISIAGIANRKSPWVYLSGDRNGNLFGGDSEGMSRSTDGGFTWTRADSGFFAAGSGSLTLLPGRRVFARSYYSVFGLGTNGIGWTKEDSARAGHFLITNAGNYLLSDGRVHKSTDGGLAWRTVVTVPCENYGSGATTIMQLPEGSIFCGTGLYCGVHGTGMMRILRSTDEGETWDLVYVASGGRPSAMAAVGNTVLIVGGGTSAGVLRSTNAGATWSQATNGMPAGASAQAFHVRSDGVILAGTVRDGMYISHDSAASWIAINSGLLSLGVRSIAVNSAGEIFIGTAGGVFRSSNNGAHWSAMNDGLFDLSVTSVLCDSLDYLYVATTTSGVFRSMSPTTSVKEIQTMIPSINFLQTNYPNPFNPATTIEFSVLKAGHISLKVYDMLGKEVATLVDEEREPGNFKVTFDASTLTSGTYFYTLRSGGFNETKKMLIVR